MLLLEFTPFGERMVYEHHLHRGGATFDVRVVVPFSRKRAAEDGSENGDIEEEDEGDIGDGSDASEEDDTKK